jgi:hypothetical protein
MQICNEFLETRIIPNTKGYVYIGIIDGHFFRSGKEMSVYRTFLENSITVIDTNKSYPNGGRNFYDIKIKDLMNNMHFIEIIGNDDDKYKDKLQGRADKYGAILVEKKYLQKLVDDILSKKDLKMEKYNDW